MVRMMGRGTTVAALTLDQVARKLRVREDWLPLRAGGKLGTVVELIDREAFAVVVDLDDSIVGRAAFDAQELEAEQ